MRRRSWSWRSIHPKLYHNAAVAIAPEESSVSSLLAELRSSASSRDLEAGKRLHARAVDFGYESNVYVANSLVSMYAKCGSLVEARRVFDRIQSRDVVSWNALILGYASQGQEEMAIKLFSKMIDNGCVPNGGSYVAAIKACIRLAGKEIGVAQGDRTLVKTTALGRGVSIHLEASKQGWDRDKFVASSLVDFYAKCGHMTEAGRVFSQMDQRDVVSWTTLILGYAENNEGETGLKSFFQMIEQCCRPNAVTFVAAIKACIAMAAKESARSIANKMVKIESLESGMEVHRQAKKFGCDTHIFVANSLIEMYSKIGSMADASRVFCRMNCHSVVSWTSLILGYVENNDPEMAMAVYSSMRPGSCSPDARIFAAALKAINELAIKERGEQIDGKIVKIEALTKGLRIRSQAEESGCADLIFVNALVDLCSKCGSLADARRIFDSIPDRTAVSWTTILLGYVENGDAESALELFQRMRPRGCDPDARTFAAVLKASGSILAMEVAKNIYTEICRGGYEKDVVLSSCLIDAFTKCGNLDSAQRVFDLFVGKDVVIWTTLIGGYSKQGKANQVFDLFSGMQDEGFRADSIALLCVLTVCSYAGLVDTGRSIFGSIRARYGVDPSFEHYHCMLDIFCRSNLLDDSVELVRSMPFEPAAATWRTILSSCRKWKNAELGKIAFDNLIKIDDSEFGIYVLMEQIYASNGMRQEQATIESMRIDARAWRKPGLGRSCWADDSGVLHKFSAGESNHSRIGEIRSKLDELTLAIKDLGIESGGDEQDALCGHSERFAIACGIINTAPRTTVRITKNLRSCDDCHRAIAMISRIEQRRIVCRESNRFHVFESGKCSCGEFW